MAEAVDKKPKAPELSDEIAGQSAAAPAAEAAPAPSGRGSIIGGLLKGLAITAIAIVGVMALVGGGMGMGAPNALTVDGTLMTTFGQGAAAGLEAGLKFLTTGLGLASIGVGAAFGGVIAHNSAKEAALAAPDSPDKTKVMELTQELEQQKALNQQLTAAKAAETPATAKTDSVVLANAEAAKPEKKDSIHIAGSIIQDRNFRASELKRRVERAENTEVKAL